MNNFLSKSSCGHAGLSVKLVKRINYYTVAKAAFAKVILFNGLPTEVMNRFDTYRKTSSISRSKPQNLNVSHLVLQLSLPNSLKPNVKLRMKM